MVSLSARLQKGFLCFKHKSSNFAQIKNEKRKKESFSWKSLKNWD